jgi:hypothetical protein
VREAISHLHRRGHDQAVFKKTLTKSATLASLELALASEHLRAETVMMLYTDESLDGS